MEEGNAASPAMQSQVPYKNHSSSLIYRFAINKLKGTRVGYKHLCEVFLNLKIMTR